MKEFWLVFGVLHFSYTVHNEKLSQSKHTGRNGLGVKRHKDALNEVQNSSFEKIIHSKSNQKTRKEQNCAIERQ